jgi:glycosyltransferase involved in cell wall biosynthesis
LNAEEARAVRVFHAHEAIWLPGLAVEAAGTTGAAVLGKATSENPLTPVGYDIPLRRKWARLRLRAAYIAPADYLKRELTEKGIPEERVFTIPNGVVLPAEISPRLNRNEVLYVGNLSQGAAYKAFDVLFDAWKQVRARIPSARLNVLGGGETEFWRKRVERDGCAESVRFRGYQPDPAPFFREVGCFVLPSRKEGMSNALLEAQAWGLPCVLSDIPANRAVAADGENAVFVPAGDAAALADGICRLLADEALCRRLGAAARQNIERNFDIRATAERLLDVYRTLTASSDGGAP